MKKLDAEAAKNSDIERLVNERIVANESVSWSEVPYVEAKANNGAKLIVVDPRFTRSAAVADVYAPIRPGTDIAFLSGVMRYLLGTGKIHQKYVNAYTNASYLVKEGFKFEEKIVGGAVPRQYIPSVEIGVTDFMKSGPLGFPVVDVAVTLKDDREGAGYDVKHIADGKLAVDVTYIKEGKLHRVRAKQSIMAGYNMMIPYMVPEMPEPQKEALRQNAKQGIGKVEGVHAHVHQARDGLRGRVGVQGREDQVPGQ